MTTTSHSYRADIDGLRAAAVLAVVLYHFKLGFPGGFVGVDVFFVISGFLISSLIIKDVDAGSFSLADFWERRIRRILPALTVVVTSTFLFAYLIYLPSDLETLARSLAAQSMLAANVFFLLQPDGYFAPGIDTKPLLHTWSLAVEEQFYLFFPLLLVWLSRWRRFTRGNAIFVLAIASFVSSELIVRDHPSAAFYLLPTRAWELLMGTLVATFSGRLEPGRKLAEAEAWIGSLLIALPLFLYDENTRFPGITAFPPCLGTAMLIHAGESTRHSLSRILSWRPTVQIGLISYSLYLWHWPVFVFATYLLGPQTWPYRVSLVLLSGALAVLSWKYVETPLRKRRILEARRRLFTTALSITVTTVFVATVCVVSRGAPARFSASALAYASGHEDFAFRNSIAIEDAESGIFPGLGEAAENAPVYVLVWGDSHAMGITPAVDRLGRQMKFRGVQATRHGTPPILTGNENSDASRLGKAVLAYMVEEGVENLVMTGHWKFYARSDAFLPQVKETIDRFLKAGIRVYLLKDVPDHGVDVPRIAALVERFGGDIDEFGTSRQEHESANARLASVFKELDDRGVTVLDPADYLLNPNDRYAMVRDGRALYTDGNHLSASGALELMPLLAPFFGQESERPQASTQ